MVDKKAKQTFFFGGRRLGAGEEHKEAATAIDTKGGLAGTKLIIGWWLCNIMWVIGQLQETHIFATPMREEKRNKVFILPRRAFSE